MRGFVNIVSAEKFDEWKKEQKADPQEDDSW
jgi:heme/copper-type cytochrome/quinol oxidase subunit 2